MTGSNTWSGRTLTAKLLLAYARIVPNHPAKLRIFRILARRLYPLGIPLKTSDGVRIAIDPGDFIGHSLCFGGCYEPLSLQLAQRLMMKGGLFLDIGCNSGLYTFTVGSLRGVRCIAVDASPLALASLDENRKLNPKVNVIVVHAALGDEPKLRWLTTPDADNKGMTRVTAQKQTTRGTPSLVAGATIQNVLQEIGGGRPQLMKIDVEGFELRVLQGLDWEGLFRPRNIIIEFSGRVSEEFRDNEACFSFLREKGFEARTVTGEIALSAHSLPEENCWFADSRLAQ